MKLDWASATLTSTPDVTAVDYLRIDLNYGAGYTDDTDFRIDDIILVRPEKLEVHYQSWAIAETSTTDSTALYELTATTNVPWYSGLYDFFNVYVAHQAAAILFRQMGQDQDALTEEAIASRELQRLKRKFPTTKLTPTKNFKPQGLNFNK